jgi:hypothetical protein
MITEWLKSTRSASSGQCVEQRRNGAKAELRDSKDKAGPTLTLRTDAYAAFLGAAKNGELDSLSE